MLARSGAWFLAVPVAFAIVTLGLSVESLPPGEHAKMPPHLGRSSAFAPFLRFARLGLTNAEPAVSLKIAATNTGPLVPIKVSTLLPDARTFCVDVDLDHDGRFEGAGELAYATGKFDEAGTADLRLRGLIDGRYRTRVRVDGIEGEVASAIEKFELLPPRNGHLPISFAVNKGQTDSSVLFLGRAKNQMVYVTRDETVLVTTTGRAELRKEPVDSPTANPTPNTVQFATRFRLAGANSWAQPTGQKMLPGKANYFIGNKPELWRTDIDTYEELSTDAYPGIRMIHRSSQGRLAYDFRVAPGANPADITLDFSDAERLSLNDDGDLNVHHAAGETIRHSAPVMYQEQRGKKQAVKGDWVLKGKQAAFVVAAYDRGRELVIDPVVFSTYLGGTVNDIGRNIAVDGAGNSYVIGDSNSADFPTTAGTAQPVKAGLWDVVVVKLNPAGTAVIYATFLGGGQDDRGNAIRVDAVGNAYIIGRADVGGFPTTPGALQTVFGGVSDAFVAKLNSAGSMLLYSTFVGGSGTDEARGVAIDAAGNAYVTGDTLSNDFPTTPGAFKTTFSGGGARDLFIAKLDPAGAALVYSTYMGGSSGVSLDIGRDIAVDAAGNAYVTGQSSSSDFETTPGAFQVTLAGSEDAIVVKMNPTGTALVYSTFIGGTAIDQSLGIAIDAGGNVYIAGATASNDFPTTAGAFQTVALGGLDVFVTKLNPAGNALVYSTYFGGVGADGADGIAIDGAGNVYVAGVTSSAAFPTVNPIQSTWAGGKDAFATVVNPVGSALVFSTYLGGTADDVANGLAIDASGAIYLTGQTLSTNYPTLTPVQATIGGVQDLFIAKLTPGPGGPSPPPPPPTPGGGIGEGNYPGSQGLGNGNGGEGTFGFGRSLKPMLKGPYQDSPGLLRVFNVAHQQQANTPDRPGGLGILGWSAMLLAAFVTAAIVHGRRRPA